MTESLRRWLLTTVFWLALVVLSASLMVNMRDESGRLITWGFALHSNSTYAIFWIPVSIAVFAWVQRSLNYLLSGLYLLWVLRMVVMLALIVLAKAVFVVLLNPWFFWYPEVPAFAEVLAASLRNNLWITLMVTGIAHALIYFEREQHIQLKLAKLESSLATAQLASLSAQLNPHFLFNALNSVAELVHHDAVAADRMLVALSSLLRRSLDAVPMQVGLLKDELALLHSYLDIEKVRLGERLQLSWAIDEACLEALVPVLILQPIVENAIVHAIAKRQAPGLLSVRIEREQAHLVMRVSDSGGGPFNADRGSSSGIGLSNTRGRLQQIYGDSQAVLLTQNDTGGTTVIVRLPYRTDPTKLKWEEWLHESSAHRNR